MSGDIGDFLAEGGANVGGGAALGATVFFIAGSLVHDFRPGTDPDQWARKEQPSDAVGRIRARWRVPAATTVLAACQTAGRDGIPAAARARRGP